MKISVGEILPRPVPDAMYRRQYYSFGCQDIIITIGYDYRGRLVAVAEVEDAGGDVIECAVGAGKGNSDADGAVGVGDTHD